MYFSFHVLLNNILKEYNMPDVNRRQYLLTMYKRAKKSKFDVDRYNVLRREIAEIEHDLRRLRDPLTIQLPPHINRSQQEHEQQEQQPHLQQPSMQLEGSANGRITSHPTKSNANGKRCKGTKTTSDTVTRRTFSSCPWSRT